MKPYLIQLGIFACYSIFCYLWSTQSDNGGGGYQIGALIFLTVFLFIHTVATIILMFAKICNWHHLIAILIYVLLTWFIINLLF